MKKKKRKSILFAFLTAMLLGAVAVTALFASASDTDFKSVVMNVGANQATRNLTWYTDFDGIAEVHYAKAQSDSLPDEYSVTKATTVKVSGGYSHTKGVKHPPKV